jgi:hypothetical protein
MSDDANTPPVDTNTPPVDTPPVNAPPVNAPPVDTPPEDKPPVDTPPEDKPPVDPYADLKVDLPDNMVLDEEGLGEFKALAAKHGIAPEAAQALMDLYADRVDSWAASVQAQADAWADETRADPDIGGAKLEDALKAAGQARAKFGSKELDSLLDTTGVGNHPAVVKFFVAIGRAISEDSIVTGGTRREGPLDAAKILYPNLS